MSLYKVFFMLLLSETNVDTSEQLLNELFTSGGMQGMLGTIWLIICAMVLVESWMQ